MVPARGTMNICKCIANIRPSKYSMYQLDVLQYLHSWYCIANITQLVLYCKYLHSWYCCICKYSHWPELKVLQIYSCSVLAGREKGNFSPPKEMTGERIFYIFLVWSQFRRKKSNYKQIIIFLSKKEGEKLRKFPKICQKRCQLSCKLTIHENEAKYQESGLWIRIQE